MLSKIERSVYIRRKRKLFFAIEFIRNKLSNNFNEFENYFVIDSMPFAQLKVYFKSFDISKASVHDIHYLKDIKNQFSNCVVLGDKPYLSADYQIDLFESKQIKLEVPMRKNQHNYKKQTYIFRMKRKRIETLFSQLCDQLYDTKKLCQNISRF